MEPGREIVGAKSATETSARTLQKDTDDQQDREHYLRVGQNTKESSHRQKITIAVIRNASIEITLPRPSP